MYQGHRPSLRAVCIVLFRPRRRCYVGTYDSGIPLRVVSRV